MSNDVSANRSMALVFALMVLILVLILSDVWTDYRAGTTTGHIAVELAVLVLSAVGVLLLWREFQIARFTVAELRVDIEAAQREANSWRDETRNTVREFRAAIERQFDRWNLSRAERDVAMCLLRGLSHKEVAALRKTSERTVREQARSVYQKSAVGGRSGLAAFFLDDLTKNP